MKLKDVFSDPAALYVIGEISCNHNNSLDTVLETIERLVDVGADAVKIQTDALDGTGSTMDFDNEYFVVKGGTPWDGARLMDLYRAAYTPLEWHEPIFEFCRQRDIECFSTPYSHETLDFLARFEPPAIKVASMEANDLSFVRACAGQGVPIIISTGMIDSDQARDAVKVCHDLGNREVVLLKCVSEYPAAVEDMQLAAIPRLRDELQVVPGLSDHSLNHVSAITATALGGQVIEKHVKLDDSIGGPDASFSLTVEAFGEMISLCHQARAAVGEGRMVPKTPNPSYSRSIFVVKDVRKGDVVSAESIRVIRPGYGLPPNDFDRVLGKRFAADVSAGQPLREEHVTE